MSRIEKLAIRGVRSFDPQEEVKIEFFRPLTLIQGHNGSGKTTIIECLKMASCGSLPPLSTNGKTFINDPKINGSNETKAGIKLKFLTPRDKEVLIIRNFQLSLKNNKYEFKRLEQLLKSYNSNGELVTINSTCIDIDKQVPLLMHSSRAIIENVIFCHQEETNWPFTEAGNLKKVFDEIFDTAKYTKALEDLKEINKQYNSRTKELKIKIELTQKDYEQFKKINTNVEFTNAKIEEINKIVEELSENLSKAQKDYKQIIEYEDQFRQKEHEIIMTRMRIEEKSKQISTIQSDPFFQDFTSTEEEYQNFVVNYQAFLVNQQNMYNNEESRYSNSKHHLERFHFDLRTLTDEINNIDATVISRNQMYMNLVINKNEVVDQLNRLESLELKFISTNDYREIYESLHKRDLEVKEKLLLFDEKKRSFEEKLSEKINDYEIERALIENKKREIEVLQIKKNEFLKMLNNRNDSVNSLNEINSAIIKIQEEIQSLENGDSGELDRLLNLEENQRDQLKQMISKFPSSFKNNEILLFYVNKMSESLTKLNNLNSLIKDKIVSFNHSFNTNYSTAQDNYLSSLEEIVTFIDKKKEQIIEEKQSIREQSLTINTQIEMCERNLSKVNEELMSSARIQEALFNEIKFLFDKMNIPLSSGVEGFNNNIELFITNVTADVNKLLIFKSELESVLQNLNSEKSTKQMEIKFLEEYISSLVEEKECAFCSKAANKTEVATIKKKLSNKIADLASNNNLMKIKIEEKSGLLEEINKVDVILKKLQTHIDENKKNLSRQKDIEKELDKYYKERKYFDNFSKEKTMMINQLEIFLGKGSSSNEEIFKLKSDFMEVRNSISKLCENLKLNTTDLSQNSIHLQLNELTNSLKEYNQLEQQIKIIERSIQEKQTIKSNLLEKLNKFYSDLRTLEAEKIKLSKFSDTNEISNKIFEIDGEISSRKSEIEMRELELSKRGEIKSLMVNKKIEFETIYNEKNIKYRTLLDKINHFKIKIEYALGDIEKMTNTMILNSNQMENSSIENVFSAFINNLKHEKETKENRKIIIEKEIQKLTEELSFQEDEKKKLQMKENLYKNNLLIYSLKGELRQLSEFLAKNESKVTINNKITSAKEKISEKMQLLSSQCNLNQGKLHELNNNLNRLTSELKNDVYFDIDGRYNKFKVEYILSIETSKQVESYYEALDQSLLKYHARRMEEINKLINYYWSMTYKGNDIKWIEIRSDVEKTARSRSYNYRIVYGTSEDQELDMRGRCSAGQKVLASIIIRLALAETFCNNCGILCLDEPTTNLDEHHVKSLANALREIIQSRSDDQNFQLIVITHDPTFVDLIGSDCCDSFWYVSKNDRKFSKVELKPINSIFNS